MFSGFHSLKTDTPQQGWLCGCVTWVVTQALSEAPHADFNALLPLFRKSQYFLNKGPKFSFLIGPCQRIMGLDGTLRLPPPSMGRVRFPQTFPNVCFLLRGVPAGNGSFIPGSGAPSALHCHAPFLILHLSVWVSQVVLAAKNPSVSAGDVRDLGLIPGSGRSPTGGHGNPLQHSCLGNPMDRGAWWATVHRVTKSWTQLKRLSPHTVVS